MARILVAEDDQAVAAFVARALEYAGHEVTAVGDGAAALAALAGAKFDLLLTDIVMPGLDGIALALKATRDHPDLRILLIKNPAGANEVLRTLALEPGEHDLLGVLNDQIADGRDVSWIWDADFELLAGRVRRATCAGTRAADLATRLKYAGIEPEHIVVREGLADALEDAVSAEGEPAPFAQKDLFGLEASEQSGGDEESGPVTCGRRTALSGGSRGEGVEPLRLDQTALAE